MALPTLTLLDGDYGFTAGDIDTSGYVAVVPAFQKIYFADGRTEADGGYHKLDFLNTRISANANPAWTQNQIVTQDTSTAKGVVDEIIDNGDGTYEILLYRITSTEFTDSNDIEKGEADELLGTDITGVSTPPFWTSWVLTSGTFPDGGSNIGSLYLGRVFLNDMFHPHQWICSRAGDPLDLDTSQDDIGAAVSSQTSGLAGKIGAPLVGFIPYKNYYQIFGCIGELWIMRGDPATVSSFANLSYSDGLFSPASWCFDDKGNLYFSGTSGFYRLPVGAATSDIPPENLTLSKYPNLFSLLNLNRRTDRVIVDYDKDRFGVIFTVVMMDGAWSFSFFYDIRNDSMWPEEYAANAIPASSYYFDSYRGDYRKLLFGGQDGYIRAFDENAKDDDNGDTNSVIESYVVLGPIDLSPLTRGEGKLQELVVDLSEDTDGLDWYLYAEDSAEALIDGIENETLTAVDSGAFSSGGHQNSIRTKVRGKFLAIKLGNDTSEQSWGMEGIGIKIKITGREK